MRKEVIEMNGVKVVKKLGSLYRERPNDIISNGVFTTIERHPLSNKYVLSFRFSTTYPPVIGTLSELKRLQKKWELHALSEYKKLPTNRVNEIIWLF
jgi:hypothetical protein